jgi:hypothetical protein
MAEHKGGGHRDGESGDKDSIETLCSFVGGTINGGGHLGGNVP